MVGSPPLPTSLDLFVNRLSYGVVLWGVFCVRVYACLCSVCLLLLTQAVNAGTPGLDWVEALSRFEELPVHPNDCWHQWWWATRSAEPPRVLQQRTDDFLQTLRFLRDGVRCVPLA